MLTAFELTSLENQIAAKACNGERDEVHRILFKNPSSQEVSKRLLTTAFIEAAKGSHRLLMLHVQYRQRDLWAFLSHEDYYQGLFEMCKAGHFQLLAEFGDLDRFEYPKSLLCFCLEKMLAEKWQNEAIQKFIQNFATHTKATWFHDECIDLCRENDKPEISRFMIDYFKDKNLTQHLSKMQIG